MKKTIIRYDEAEWEGNEFVLYYKGVEVDRFYAEDMIYEAMKGSEICEYIEE